MRSGSTSWHSFVLLRLLYLLAIGLALTTLTGNTPSDTIELSSPSSASVHLLAHSTPQSPDSLYVLPASQTSMVLADRGGIGEVILFPEDPHYSLTVLPITDWQAGEQTLHHVTLNSAIEIKLAFWLVCSQDSLIAWINHCESDMLSAMAMWNQEGVGITISEYQINGVTITPSTQPNSIPVLSPEIVSNYADFTCSKAVGLVNAIDTSAGFINAFYVHEVHSQSKAGEACLGLRSSNNAVFLGCTVSPMLLAHELGHLLLLQHTYPPSKGTNAGDGINWKDLTFKKKNMMFGNIKTNATITEGQIVRLSLEPTSILNRGYGYHHGTVRSLPVGRRNCSGAVLGNKDVPRLDFWIRPD